jgi:hypothetical protein
MARSCDTVAVMATWNTLTEEAPDIAATAERRIRETGVVLVGTLRRNGWPRISATEPLVVDGDMYLGMMWRSTKALDLLRDPRVVLHTTVRDRNDVGGDVKVYGNALDVPDPAQRERYCVALREHIDWAPDGDFNLFRLDITEAGMTRVEGEDMLFWHWRPGAPQVGPRARPG